MIGLGFGPRPLTPSLPPRSAPTPGSVSGFTADLPSCESVSGEDLRCLLPSVDFSSTYTLCVWYKSMKPCGFPKADPRASGADPGFGQSQRPRSSPDWILILLGDPYKLVRSGFGAKCCILQGTSTRVLDTKASKRTKTSDGLRSSQRETLQDEPPNGPKTHSGGQQWRNTHLLKMPFTTVRPNVSVGQGSISTK